MIKQNNLTNIRIVLINTSHPGNIGAVARAMKTMSLHNLVLVDPIKFPSAEATARASGADDVLSNAKVVDTLDRALEDCRLVVGASARLRRLRWPQLNPRQCATKIVAEAAQDGDIALVFGREHSGLTNEELDRCHFLVHIPSNPEFSSLNLGAAVQVLSYELFVASQSNEPHVYDTSPPILKEDETEALANSDQMEGFYQHLELVLNDIGFLKTAHPRKLMRRLKRLYNRARMSLVELNIMRGVLSGIQAYGNKHKDKE